jgi:hypothetical protein
VHLVLGGSPASLLVTGSATGENYGRPLHGGRCWRAPEKKNSRGEETGPRGLGKSLDRQYMHGEEDFFVCVANLLGEF